MATFASIATLPKLARFRPFSLSSPWSSMGFVSLRSRHFHKCAGQEASTAADAVHHQATVVKKGIEDVKYNATQTTTDVAGKVSETPQDLAGKAKKTAENAWDTVKDTTRNIKDKVVEKVEESKEAINENAETLKQNIKSKY